MGEAENFAEKLIDALYEYEVRIDDEVRERLENDYGSWKITHEGTPCTVRARLTLVGDYFKAYEELAGLLGKLSVIDPAKAEELEDAFFSIKSEDDSYLFKAADFLEERYKEITPLQSLFDNKWQEAEGEAKLILADQLKNYFTICKARGDDKTFSQFVDEVKRIYKGLARDAIEIASQDLGEEGKEFLRLANQEEKKSRNKKLVLGLSALGLIAASSLGAYLYKHLENQRKEEMKKPYKQAGLSDDKIEEFIAKYPKQNGNSTWVDFAKSWANNRALAEESLKTFGSLKDSLDYLYFVNSNGYDGLNFLKDFPQFAKNYTLVLPAYSANSSLVKTVYDQFQNELFLKGLKEYQDLNLIKKNLMIQTVHAVNNLTLAYEQGLPRLDKDSVWLLTNATQISKDIADFEPNLLGENFNIPFDYYYLTCLISKNYESVLKYPLVARAYVKQVDQVVLPLVNESSWSEIVPYLDKLWKNHVEINEKGERLLPLDEKLIMKYLFNDRNLTEIVLRQSLLPSQAAFCKILHTNTTYRSTYVARASLETLFSNIDNFMDYHNTVWKTFTYKANNTDEVYFYLRYVLGQIEYSARIWAEIWDNLLTYPDPIKILIISWNRFVTDQVEHAPNTVRESSKYKQIMIENGTELPWVEIRIRGNESLSPQEISPNQPVGIAPIRFENDKKLTWEQAGMIITALGFKGAYTQPEEPRVEASGVIGWVVGFPLYKYGTYERNGNAHGDTGFHITPKVYDLFKNIGNPIPLPLYITNGWVLDGESVAREIEKTGIWCLVVMGGYLESRY